MGRSIDLGVRKILPPTGCGTLVGDIFHVCLTSFHCPQLSPLPQFLSKLSHPLPLIFVWQSITGPCLRTKFGLITVTLLGIGTPVTQLRIRGSAKKGSCQLLLRAPFPQLPSLHLIGQCCPQFSNPLITSFSFSFFLFFDLSSELFSVCSGRTKIHASWLNPFINLSLFPSPQNKAG